MALAQELIRVLGDKEEPLPKRLKIADNAFKSISLPIQDREALLLKWISKITKKDDNEVWSLLLKWLNSQKVQNLSTSDITEADVLNLTNVITKRLVSCSDLNLSLVVSCAIAIIESKTFEFFLKQNLQVYCNLVLNVLYKVENLEELNRFITNDRLFNKNIGCGEEFQKYFLENVLKSCGEVVEKFDNLVFMNVSKLIAKVIFQPNSARFTQYLNLIYQEKISSEDDWFFPKFLVETLLTIDKIAVYKLVFETYHTTYNNSKCSYYFLLLLIESLGFDVASRFHRGALKVFENPSIELKKSILIITELLELLTRNRIDFTCQINGISFSEFLQDLTTTTIALAKESNTDICQFLKNILILDPLNVEKSTEQILIFIIQMYKESPANEYEKLLLYLIQVFDKLKRLPNLFSTMFPSFRKGLGGKFHFKLSDLNYLGRYDTTEYTPHSVKELLSSEILNFLTHSITNMLSHMYMNLFVCFLYHLESILIETESCNLGESDTLYLELISILLCQYLQSVRIAEYVVPVIENKKFLERMDKLKSVLAKFGNVLVNSEHNQILMKSYLNICYVWGELYIMLSYYSIDDEAVFPKLFDGDSSAYNITYIHSYLSREVWSLIFQRITNFGEKSCRQIMQKLCIQKLKAMQLFEESVNSDVISSVTTTILSSVEDNWQELLSDSFSLNEIVVKSSYLTRFSELLLADVIKSGNLQQMRSFVNCDRLISTLFYLSLKKINRSFGKKQKRRSSLGRIPISSKIFVYITEELLLSDEGIVISEDFWDIFNEFENVPSEEKFTNVNEKDLSNYMDVLQTLPVMQCSNLELVIFYLIGVFIDLQSCSLENVELVKKCENLIISLSKRFETQFTILDKHLVITKTIINNFCDYSSIFSLIIHNIKDVGLFKSIADFLIDNIDSKKNIACLTILLNLLNKRLSKNTKFYLESSNLFAEYQKDVHSKILSLIKDKKNKLDYIEIYELILRTSLHSSHEKMNEDITFQRYLNLIKKGQFKFEEQKGVTMLCTTILHNFAKLNIKKSPALVAWNACKGFNVNDNYLEDYNKLIILIVELSSPELFETIVNQISLSLINAFGENNADVWNKEMKLFNAISASGLSFKKSKTFQVALQSLMFTKLLVYFNDKKGVRKESIYEDVVNLQISLIKNNHIFLEPSIREAIFVTISSINSNESFTFVNKFTLSFKLLEALLKYRKLLIMDYLCVYLQHYRHILKKLCINSNSNLKLETNELQLITDCAHNFEKLTLRLTSCTKDLSPVVPYLIADIFKQYEKVNLYPGVKAHLNNCLYSLMALCDEKAMAYLMKALSIASTEMFKIFHQNYRSYYKFDGKI